MYKGLAHSVRICVAILVATRELSGSLPILITASRRSATGSASRSVKSSSTRNWGWVLASKATTGITYRLPNVGKQATRKTPWAPPLSAAISCCASANSSSTRLALTSSAAPASVKVMSRVERLKTGVPRRASSVSMLRVIDEGATPMRRAAAEKLPSRVTWTNTSRNSAMRSAPIFAFPAKPLTNSGQLSRGAWPRTIESIVVELISLEEGVAS